MAYYSDETIEQVVEAADLVELISNYVSLKKAGNAYKGLCPFHNEKTPSFTVTPQKRMFHCFGCGAGGGAIRFLMMI
ncbi:MAG: CHC2 zinc finger domain-containing protein, partial [Candidatus Adiutrix sp.]